MPFLRLLPPLILGVIAAEHISLSASTLLISLAAILSSLFIFRGKTAQRVIIVILTFAIGVTSVKVLCPREDIPRGERVIAKCKINDNITVKGRWQRTTARVLAFRIASDTTSAWQKSREEILIYVDTAYTISLGDKIGCITYVNPLDTIGGNSGYARTMRSRGFLGQAFVTDGMLLTRHENDDRSLWENIMFVSKSIQRNLGERILANGAGIEESGVAMALLTGDKHLLDRDLREQYSKAGVSHMLAISGLHLGIIFLFLNFFLSLFAFMRRGHEAKSIIIILVLWCYAFITGLSPSVLRSAFMLSVMQLSMMTTRRYNPYNALFSSAFVLILVNPYFIYDISFQMSYLAILTILFFLPRLRRWLGIVRMEKWLREKERSQKGIKKMALTVGRNMFVFFTGAIIVAIAAQIGTTPLTGYFFGRFPLLNILINPAIMVMLMQIMFSGFIYLTIFNTPLAEYVGKVFNTLLSTQNEVVKWAASFKYSSMDYDLPLVWLYISYGAIILFMLVIKWLEDRRHNKPAA